ncbi:alpha/beta hydrolase [Streptomyces niveus]|uniref:alpha/beta hydrolase n=1 Tax=Streptomyces niveus TaxID=193462 RepID=UPI000A52C10E|nr:carboxylesterase family protein [Streptomyces niveus]
MSRTGTTVEIRDLIYLSEEGAPLRRLDVHRPAADRPVGPSVLLWHGIGPDEKDVLAPLAREIASHGLPVLVPDWRSDAPDGGRSHLMASLRYVRDQAVEFGGDGGRVVLAGWSAGAGAAMGLALGPGATEGVRVIAAVGVAGRYDLPARSTGTAPLADLDSTEAGAGAGAGAVPVTLVHGAADSVLSSSHSREFGAALRTKGWPVTSLEPTSDHAGVIMTEYDPARGLCVPSTSEHVLRAGRETAAAIVSAARTA